MRSKRHTCPSVGCGGTLGFTGEKRDGFGGHHYRVFECGECGREVLRG